eukprot:1414144-Ditylum_brightwellii.AAC.1
MAIISLHPFILHQCRKYSKKKQKVTAALHKFENKVCKAHRAHLKKLAADEKAAAYEEKVAAYNAREEARLA